MAELTIKTPIEPLKASRWVLNVGNIPHYLFRNLNLESFLEKKR